MILTVTYKRRSVWKGFFFPTEFYLLFFDSGKNSIYLKSRNILLLRVFFETKLCYFYNGKKYSKLVFLDNMQYSRAGQFIFTKKTGFFIHNTKLKKGRKSKSLTGLKRRVALKTPVRKKIAKKK